MNLVCNYGPVIQNKAFEMSLFPNMKVCLLLQNIPREKKLWWSKTEAWWKNTGS